MQSSTKVILKKTQREGRGHNMLRKRINRLLSGFISNKWLRQIRILVCWFQFSILSSKLTLCLLIFQFYIVISNFQSDIKPQVDSSYYFTQYSDAYLFLNLKASLQRDYNEEECLEKLFTSHFTYCAFPSSIQQHVPLPPYLT